MRQTIIDAINNRQVLRFTYKGDKRVAEPHCYGRDTKGHDALRAFQIGVGWRLYHTDQMEFVAWNGENFRSPRPNYNPNDKHMEQIYARL